MSTQTYVQIRVIYDREANRWSMKMRSMHSRRISNKLMLGSPIMRDYGNVISQHMIEEIVDFDPRANQLSYYSHVRDKIFADDETEVEMQPYDSATGAGEEEAAKKAVGKEKYVLSVDIIKKVQKRVRCHLVKIRFQLMMEKYRKKLRQGDEVKRELISRKFQREENNLYLLQLFYDQQERKISIRAMNKNKKPVLNEVIPEYYQVVFDDFEIQDVRFYGPNLLASAQVVRNLRNENQKKIQVKRVEELISDIKLRMMRSLNLDLNLKNSTVETRKIFNQQRLRQTFKRNQSIIQAISYEGQTFRTNFDANSPQKKYAQLIQKEFRKFLEKKKLVIRDTKLIRDDNELIDYAISIKPLSRTAQQNPLFDRLRTLEEMQKQQKGGVQVTLPVLSQPEFEEIVLGQPWDVPNTLYLIEQKVAADAEVDTDRPVEQETRAGLHDLKSYLTEPWDLDVWHKKAYQSLVINGIHKTSVPQLHSMTINLDDLNIVQTLAS